MSSRSLGTGVSVEGQDGWKPKTDPATGKTYYYNRKLRQTAWEIPDPSLGEGHWVEKENESGESIWYNPVTKARSYMKPEDAKIAHAEETLHRTLEREKSGMIKTQRLSERISMSRAVPIKTRNSQKRTSGRSNSIRLGEGLNAMPSEDKFSKLRAMRNVEGGAGSMRRESTKIDLDRLSSEMVRLEEKYDFLEYAEEHFKLTQRKGRFSKARQLDINILTRHSSAPLAQSLHGMSHPVLEKNALLANKHILAYLGDFTYKKSTSATQSLYEVLQIGIIDSPEELRDELFCQIVKQLRENPREESIQKGWILMAICTGSFPPSIALRPYLTSFLETQSETSTISGVSTFAEYALLRLQKAIEAGPREEVPCGLEVEYVSMRKPVPVSIFLVNGKKLAFEAETWTKVGALRAVIQEALAIEDDTPFALLEVSSGDGDTERVLHDDEKVLDIMAFWEAEQLAYENPEHAPDNRFVYKMHLFLDIPPEDYAALELAYFQATHDVSDSRYPVTELDLTRLIALEAQEKFGDYTGNDVFADDFEGYLPVKYSNSPAKKAQLKKLVIDRYADLKGMDKLEAKTKYLDYVKEWKVYGAQSFFVEPQNNPGFEKLVILAVNAHGVLIIDPKTKNLEAEFSWKKIMTWGKSPDNFCLVYGDYLKQTKLWFKAQSTDENEVLYSLVEAYGRHLGRG